MEITVLGGRGFVGSEYVRQFKPAFNNERNDYQVHSKDVLYLISTVHNYNVFDKPFLDIETNLITLVAVLESWRKRPDSKDGIFNFISSWFVYGDQSNPEGVSEDATPNPKGFYSITKRCAEQLLISYCETYGLKYRILRLGNIIGPGDKKASSKKNALQFIADKIKANEYVEIYGDGHFFRDYVHVEDCARAINIVLTKGRTNEVYNIGNGITWDFITILKYLKEKTESTSIFHHIEEKQFHKVVQVKSFYMNSDRLKSLGYEPKYTGAKLYNTLVGDSE